MLEEAAVRDYHQEVVAQEVQAAAETVYQDPRVLRVQEQLALVLVEVDQKDRLQLVELVD
jgi:tryptophan 2,3-dioxygenase